ncbi:MAG: diaminobutyrate acetyltransferase [Parahaliea sp.]
MTSEITLRAPIREDGGEVYRLIGQCPPLDTNSLYCNLLQCTHFADTSVAALQAGQLVGFVSGYILPGRKGTLFIWQVAVGEQARGRGLASVMLAHILDREHCREVCFVETTITESNTASWALFRGFAEHRAAQLESRVLFDGDRHFAGAHASELLVRIGPLTQCESLRASA